MAYFEKKNGTIILNVRVTPRASKDEIQGIVGDRLKVRIMAPPLEGKANAQLVKFLSRRLKIPRAHIEILSGESGRDKRIRISDPPDDLPAVLLSIGQG